MDGIGQRKGSSVMQKFMKLIDVCEKFGIDYNEILLSRKGRLQCQDEEHKHILSVLHNDYGFYVESVRFIDDGLSLDMRVKDLGSVGIFTLTKSDGQLRWHLDKLS